MMETEVSSHVDVRGYTYNKKEFYGMATNKQVYYMESLIGNVIVNEKFSNKEEVWDAIELLPETTLESVNNKTASQIIKKLESLSTRNK